MNRWTSGILVDNDVESITQENCDMILKKAENVANSWTNRGLTLIRKVCYQFTDRFSICLQNECFTKYVGSDD